MPGRIRWLWVPGFVHVRAAGVGSRPGLGRQQGGPARAWRSDGSRRRSVAVKRGGFEPWRRAAQREFRVVRHRWCMRVAHAVVCNARGGFRRSTSPGIVALQGKTTKDSSPHQYGLQAPSSTFSSSDMIGLCDKTGMGVHGLSASRGKFTEEKGKVHKSHTKSKSQAFSPQAERPRVARD